MNGASINAFARKAGLSASSVHRVLHGGEPSLTTVLRIAQAAGVSPVWMMTGEVALEGPNEPEAGALPTGFSETAAAYGAVDLSVVPVDTLDVSEGSGTHIESRNLPPFGKTRFPRRILHGLGVHPEDVCLTALRGVSMEPTIQDGAIVLMDRADTQIADGRIYAFTLNNLLQIKRLRFHRCDLIMFCDNTHLFPEEVLAEDDDFRVFGRVRWTGSAL